MLAAINAHLSNQSQEKVTIKQPGFHPQLTCEDYFAEPCPSPALTNSGVRTLLNACPARSAFEHPAIGQPEESRNRLPRDVLWITGSPACADKGDDYGSWPVR